MEPAPDPFPLAVNSSHHSHYHRFLLGADAALVAPFPKPYCVGQLKAQLPDLADRLDLPRWRKLYHASIPWVDGFAARHYQVGNVPPYRPLPPEYGRPERRFAAFDFVQIADPAVSALALVAGDRRVLDGFLRLNDDFCLRVERAARADRPGSGAATGRFLAGQFAEPNNRWLLPFLHVHARVLNFTAPAAQPRDLAALDLAALRQEAPRARQHWVERQADRLNALGYLADVRGRSAGTLAVRGVPGKLLSALEAPRIAVLQLLERLVLGQPLEAPGRHDRELPRSAIATMAEHLADAVRQSLAWFRPPKIALPAEGPWRAAVRAHLRLYCADGLAALDAVALRARAVPWERGGLPVPAEDAAHRHALDPRELAAPPQRPTEPELGADRGPGEAPQPSAWLAREFAAALQEVSERIVRAGPADPFTAQRELLGEVDRGAGGATCSEVAASQALVDAELERRREPCDRAVRPPPTWDFRPALPRLPELAVAEPSLARDLGGRSR
jgi:hypothetical protein